jgi:colanic acid/amylovoran biosynthesis glycosyltransferase
MHKVLELYNILGALPERVWLEYPTALAQRFAMTLGYETLSEDAPKIDLPTVPLARVNVEPTQDIAEEAKRLNVPTHPAWKLVNGDFRLVHGHTGPRLLQAMPFLLRGIPVVLSLYGYDASRLLRDVSWAARYRFAAERGAVLVTLCNAMSQKLTECGVPESAIRIVRLGLHLERWKYAPTPAPASPRFVFIGRLTAKKGVGDLLKALATLRDRRASLDIAGGGPLEGELKALATKLEIADRVRIHGQLPRERISDLLAGATAFVLPSVTAPDGDAEGTPVVLMEAQAVGVPCVTTRHSGNPEVLPPDSSLIANEHDPESLAEAMRRVAEMTGDERASLQAAGRAWVESNYDLRQTIRAYGELYDELINARP